ncbi:hypothetical protein [Limnoglobus roseus]|uniref:Tetratricopeptide repeat protein n=1 Tax=Limnoglobus roseus TaxID=2598579 RepID=A0A5C1AB24_9BACT|nr:hypothetical protein [Limnoglobus roseus]QEL14228.1 tetratricopeptide repeat protein [Limnoglobus roseus]
MRIGCFRGGYLVAALFFGLCAGFAGYLTTHLDLPREYQTASSPMPHFVPKYDGGVSLRYAMVHDVIHERFPVRGPGYYRERDRQARERLKTLPPDSQEAFDLADDLGVGLDKLGRPADGVPILREKFERQQKKGLTGRDLYTTYANLGTVLIHANLKAALTGDKAAKEQAKEGLKFIRKSIEVNPEAHFGREEWQAHIAEYLLACTDTFDLLTKFDCVGDRLDDDARWSRSAVRMDFQWEHNTFKQDFSPDGTLKNREHRSDIRDNIRTVGVETGWPKSLTLLTLQKPVPFDEPTLGIIGMWRQGGGANPYFAVTLGEIMLRVGQRYIAWTAYERASSLADKYGWKPEHATFLLQHCRGRQREIEQQLPANEVPKLRAQFEAELAHGQQFQHDYQEFEAKKIAAGADLHDEHFFDDFYKNREPIATPIGESEWYARVDREAIAPLQDWTKKSTALLWGGIVGFTLILLGRIAEWSFIPRAQPTKN